MNNPDMNTNTNVSIEYESGTLCQNVLHDNNDMFNQSSSLHLATSPEKMSANLKILKELEFKHEKNENLTRRLSIYSIPVLYFLGSDIVSSILQSLNMHVTGLIAGAAGLGGIILMITLLGSIEPDMCPRFKWIHKLLRRSSGFDKKERQYEGYLNSLYSLFKTDEFAHTYLAHVQMKLTGYQQVALELSESDNRQYHFYYLNKLKEKIEKLQELQSILVECMVQKNDYDNLFMIQLIEEKMGKTDNLLKEKSEQNTHQQDFVKKHQQFLDNNDLSHLIVQTDNNWANYRHNQENKTTEHNLKTLL